MKAIQIKDFDECEKKAESGLDKNCFECSCKVCLAQEHELRQLARIGKATEKALNQGYDFIYNTDVLGECEIEEMYSTKDLLKWAESEGE